MRATRLWLDNIKQEKPFDAPSQMESTLVDLTHDTLPEIKGKWRAIEKIPEVIPDDHVLKDRVALQNWETSAN